MWELADTNAELRPQQFSHATNSAGDDSDDVDVDHSACEALVALIEADSKSFRRERRCAFRSLLRSQTNELKSDTVMPGHELAPGVTLDFRCTDPHDGLP